MLCITKAKLYTQQFSVLTCSRGDEIYSTFGHSAIRYRDSMRDIDWVYNYGLFDFYDPNFIPKFCMGRLDYMVAKESMMDFMGQYIYQRREVKEQVLDLSASDRDSLLAFLEWNILEENKFYRYDFLFNNCATKIIDVIEKNCAGVSMKFFDEENKKTFREHIHANAQASVPWIDWGMDLALGMSVDARSTARQYCFLPEFVAKSIAISTSQNSSLVATENLIVPETPRQSSKWSLLWSPVAFALLILLLSIYLRIKYQSWSRLFYGMLFFALGLGGFIIGFEWFFTEHSVTKNNLNLLWLNPVFILYSVMILARKNWRYVSKFVQICLSLALINVFFEFQELHWASKIIILAAFISTNVFLNLNIRKEKFIVEKS